MPNSATANALDDQQRVWEDWARADPLWAILSDPDRRGGRWDVDEFFRTGEVDIDVALADTTRRWPALRRDRCLDFGCGVGRLTQALADRFTRADGVDISATMVELAGRYNRHGDRCVYHVNTQPDLSLFSPSTFDFVFSTIVLQHNPPDVAAGYIAEFVRLLTPDGIAVFDMTAQLNDHKLTAHSHRAELSLVDLPPRLLAGRPAQVRLKVTNTSGIDWPAGCWLSAGNHWRSADGGKLLTLDDGRAELHEGLAAGDSIEAVLTINAPARSGNYRLEFDLVEEGVAWFGDLGSAITSVAVPVDRARSRPLARFRRAARTTEPPAEPKPFTMNGLTHQQVSDAVAAAGGRILSSEPDTSGGHHWEGYRYFVVRADAMGAGGAEKGGAVDPRRDG